MDAQSASNLQQSFLFLTCMLPSSGRAVIPSHLLRLRLLLYVHFSHRIIPRLGKYLSSLSWPGQLPSSRAAGRRPSLPLAAANSQRLGRRISLGAGEADTFSCGCSPFPVAG